MPVLRLDALTRRFREGDAERTVLDGVTAALAHRRPRGASRGRGIAPTVTPVTDDQKRGVRYEDGRTVGG